MKRLLCVALVFFAVDAKSQTVLDDVYVREHIPTKAKIASPYVVERDVMWQKRVWRVIDLREKMNFPLHYPLKPNGNVMSLFDVLKHYMLSGEITVYAPLNLLAADLNEADFGADQFMFPLNQTSVNYVNEVKGLLMSHVNESTTPYQVYDPETGMTVDSVDFNQKLVYAANDTVWIETKDVIAWEIKEDWFFDKTRSVMDVRILGVAPVVYTIDPNTNAVLGTRTLFWLYFPEIQYVLQNHFVFNRMNDAQRMSFNDLFVKRMFSSYIKKESNICDRKITDYVAGVDALLEAERVKNDISQMEHDVWDI